MEYGSYYSITYKCLYSIQDCLLDTLWLLAILYLNNNHFIVIFLSLSALQRYKQIISQNYFFSLFIYISTWDLIPAFLVNGIVIYSITKKCLYIYWDPIEGYWDLIQLCPEHWNIKLIWCHYLGLRFILVHSLYLKMSKLFVTAKCV